MPHGEPLTLPFKVAAYKAITGDEAADDLSIEKMDEQLIRQGVELLHTMSMLLIGPDKQEVRGGPITLHDWRTLPKEIQKLRKRLDPSLPFEMPK